MEGLWVISYMPSTETAGEELRGLPQCSGSSCTHLSYMDARVPALRHLHEGWFVEMNPW